MRLRVALFIAGLAVVTHRVFAASGFLFGSWVLGTSLGVPASLDLNFTNNSYYQDGLGFGSAASNYLTVSRTSVETTLLPSSAAGVSYQTFGNNVAAITSFGLQVYEGRTNALLNSTAPATQTTGSLTCSSGCTLWVNGSGSATPSAGTATGCSGFAAATNGSPDTFTCSGTGTIVVTVSGSLNTFQLEIGSFGTPLIVTAGTTASRPADVVTATYPPTFGSAYSLYASGTPQAPAGYSAIQAAIAAYSSATNYFIPYRAGSDLSAIQTNAGNAGTNYAVGSAWNAGVFSKLAGSTVGANQNIAFAGVIGTPSTSATPSGLNLVNIGSQPGGTASFDGTISRIALWPTMALSSATLQLLTGGQGAVNESRRGYAANDDFLPRDVLRRAVWR